ncbi:hypothetical protein QN277_024526 [Acacia crassicarpa]|uniref:C2H2-type domain-containing protein n=1 Tax=Acacia crassicarpa TaxID=499986 RepID=A0AAE1JC87_9FABA|nr:hypothetical protein QN277_024526 [Acacia crassicarpa]
MSLMDIVKRFNFKHFCKKCKKGFGSGRALGDHMKAHGIRDKSSAMDDDDDDDDDDAASDGEDRKLEGDANKQMYSISKKKRSSRVEVGISFNNNNPNCSSPNEDEYLANCLMLLSNKAHKSSTVASKEGERVKPNFCLMTPMSSDHTNKGKEVDNYNNNKSWFECKACKKVFNSHQALGGHRASHKKVKGCFAARPHNLDEVSTVIADDDAITQEDPLFPTNHNSNNSNSTLHLDHGSNNNNAPSSKRKSKVHECSICRRVFLSGQALGGHKRCHWITSTAPDTLTLVRFQQFQEQIEQHMKYNNPVIPDDNKFADFHEDPIHLKLDLNLPVLALSTARNVSAEMYLQGSGGRVPKQHEDEDDKVQSYQNHELDKENNNDEEGKNSNRNVNISKDSTMQKEVEDEETNDSKVKLAKLSEDDVGGSSLPWLQVGIGSTTTSDIGNGP